MSRSTVWHHDYVIVGAGPAACVLAMRLSENPAVKVLLLEAGSGRNSMVARMLARFVRPLDPQLRWMYETVPQPALNGRRLFLPQGRTLGGATAFNAMTYVRGQPSDYDGWKAAGNSGWESAAVLDAFKRLENNHAFHDEFHGANGPLDVSDQLDPHLLSHAFVAAAREAGFSANADFNGAKQEGAGFYQVTQLNGKRCSAARAFLDPAKDRANLTILTHARATAVMLNSGRATGVEFIHAGRRNTASAGSEVIVSCGAINSPRLLLLSGIGPARELKQLGIAAAHNLAGVGKNLVDHVNVPVASSCTQPITYDHWDTPARFLANWLRYILFSQGIGASNICEAGAFLRSTSAATSPDIQLHFMPLIWLDHGGTRLEGYGMTLEAACLRPESRGCLTLASNDPLADPVIDPGYCNSPGDVRVLVHGLRHCRAIMNAPSLRNWVSAELRPGAAVQSESDLVEYVRANAVSAYHPVGTCRMGNDELAVVDERLRVRGIESLRVVDSSIMLTIVSGSTQAPSMMIGEMGARMILEDQR